MVRGLAILGAVGFDVLGVEDPAFAGAVVRDSLAVTAEVTGDDDTFAGALALVSHEIEMLLLTGYLDDLVANIQVVELLVGEGLEVFNLDRCGVAGEFRQNGDELTGSQLATLLKHCIEGNNHFFFSHDLMVLGVNG